MQLPRLTQQQRIRIRQNQLIVTGLCIIFWSVIRGVFGDHWQFRVAMVLTVLIWVGFVLLVSRKIEHEPTDH